MDQVQQQQEQTEEAGIIRQLGRLEPGALVTEDGLARLLGRHPCTIRRAVDRGELPVPVKMLGKPTWTAAIILRHIETRLAQAQKEAEQEAKRLARIAS